MSIIANELASLRAKEESQIIEWWERHNDDVEVFSSAIIGLSWHDLTGATQSALRAIYRDSSVYIS